MCHVVCHFISREMIIPDHNLACKTFDIYHEVKSNLNKKPLHQPKDHSLQVGIPWGFSIFQVTGMMNGFFLRLKLLTLGFSQWENFGNYFFNFWVA